MNKSYLHDFPESLKKLGIFSNQLSGINPATESWVLAAKKEL